MLLEEFYIKAYNCILETRDKVTPLNQKTGYSWITNDSLNQFNSERNNLLPLSPRSQAHNIYKGKVGNCGELAMYLSAQLIKDFADYNIKCKFKCSMASAVNIDHAFSVVLIDIELPNYGASVECLFEVDAWDPRIELVESHTLDEMKFISQLYEECIIMKKPYYNYQGFMAYHKQNPPLQDNVNYGQFQWLTQPKNVGNSLPKWVYKDYSVDKTKVDKQYHSASIKIDKYLQSSSMILH